MPRLRALLLAATILLPAQAMAMAEPTPGPRDPRIRSIAYDPLQLVRLQSTNKLPLQIIFDDGEKPLMIAGPGIYSDPDKASEGWFARPSGNMLLLQPMKPDVSTTLFLRTMTQDGKDRHYVFQLSTRQSQGGDLDAQSYLSVQFTYKAAADPDAVEAAKARRQVEQEAKTQQVVATQLYQSTYGGAANTYYFKRDPLGCPIIGPVRAYDNGVMTSLVFTPNVTLPEVYVINQDGKEAITTPMPATSATGIQINIPGIYQELRLRRGGKVCAIRNAAYDSVGRQPGGGTGTISPDVKRTVRQ